MLFPHKKLVIKQIIANYSIMDLIPANEIQK